MKTVIDLWRTSLVFAPLVGIVLVASVARAQPVPCETPADYPCDFQIGTIGISKVSPIFKFQSRVSQAKLPIGEGTFSAIFVKVLDGAGAERCREEFRDVTVRDSVLNLEIGHNMSCELEDVIAQEQDLAFQICLGNANSCLKAVSLSASPLAVKSTFSSLSEKAHQADFAGQAHYAHRVTADRNLLTSSSLGFGYFDFYTHVAADADALYPGAFAGDFARFANGAFIQWTPVGDPGARSIHVVAKDQATDKLVWLDDYVVFAHNSRVMGDLTVNERGDQDLGITVTGDSRIEGTCADASGCTTAQLKPSLEVVGQILVGYDPVALNGFADHRSHGIDGDLQILGDASNTRAALEVTGQVLVGHDPARLRGDGDGVTHGIDGDLEILGDLTGDVPSLSVTGQVIAGHNLVGLAGMTDYSTHGIDGDVQIRGDAGNPRAGLEVTGRLLAGANPSALVGYGDGVSSGIDSPLQVTGALTVDAGGIHVFGGADSEIWGNTRVEGTVTVGSNGHVSVPTGRVETFGGLWLSDNTTQFQPAVVSGDSGGAATLLINPFIDFVQTEVNGTVVFHDQVFFDVPPFSEVDPAITAGSGIVIDIDPAQGAPYKRISIDDEDLSSRYMRADGSQDIQIGTGSKVVFGNAAVDILNISRANNVVTVETASPHGLANNTLVTVDASDNTFDATNVPIAAISATQMRYTQVGSNVSPKADTGTVTSQLRAEVLRLANEAPGAAPTLLINAAMEFGTVRLNGDIEVVNGPLSVESQIRVRKTTEGWQSAVEADGTSLAINKGSGFDQVRIEGGALVSGGLRVNGTLAASCPSPTERVGAWCVSDTPSTLGVGQAVSAAFSACTNQGMAVCSADAMVHCKYSSSTSSCVSDMGDASGSRVLTSTLLQDNAAFGLNNRWAVWSSGDFTSAAGALIGSGGVFPALYYCCTAATSAN